MVSAVPRTSPDRRAAGLHIPPRKAFDLLIPTYDDRPCAYLDDDIVTELLQPSDEYVVAEPGKWFMSKTILKADIRQTQLVRVNSNRRRHQSQRIRKRPIWQAQ